jgi:hypothetical protein
MTHQSSHVIIHKLKEFAANNPRAVKYGSLMLAFVAGAVIF